MRILAVDPGEKRLGLAISDPSGTIANPLQILKHRSRAADAAAIVRIATEQGASRIIVGQALDVDGKPGFEGRRAARLARAIQELTDLPVELWDESGSSLAAEEARRQLGVSQRRRRQPLDHLAATVILQSYLDAQHPSDQGQANTQLPD